MVTPLDGAASPHPRRRRYLQDARQGRGECAVRGAPRHPTPKYEESGDARQGERRRCPRVRPATYGPLHQATLCGGAGRVLETGGETGRRRGGGRGVCHRQRPRSQSSGRASSCPPSPPQQQPTVAPSFWCACWWATRKRACGWASTMAPSETTSPHRTPARAAASGMRASYRQDRLSSSCPEFDFRAARKYITTWV